MKTEVRRSLKATLWWHIFETPKHLWTVWTIGESGCAQNCDRKLPIVFNTTIQSFCITSKMTRFQSPHPLRKLILAGQSCEEVCQPPTPKKSPPPPPCPFKKHSVTVVTFGYAQTVKLVQPRGQFGVPASRLHEKGKLWLLKEREKEKKNTQPTLTGVRTFHEDGGENRSLLRHCFASSRPPPPTPSLFEPENRNRSTCFISYHFHTVIYHTKKTPCKCVKGHWRICR